MGSLLSCDVWYQNGSYVSVQVHLLEGRSKSDQTFSFWYSPMHKDQLNKEQKVVSLSVFKSPLPVNYSPDTTNPTKWHIVCLPKT